MVRLHLCPYVICFHGRHGLIEVIHLHLYFIELRAISFHSINFQCLYLKEMKVLKYVLNTWVGRFFQIPDAIDNCKRKKKQNNRLKCNGRTEYRDCYQIPYSDLQFQGILFIGSAITAFWIMSQTAILSACPGGKS